MRKKVIEACQDAEVTIAYENGEQHDLPEWKKYFRITSRNEEGWKDGIYQFGDSGSEQSLLNLQRNPGEEKM